MRGQRDGLLGLCLACLLFSVYLITFSGSYHSSDEMSMLAATDSIARRGTLDIELLHWMGEQQGSFGPDGHLYSRKGIGTTLVALPHYWLALQFQFLGNVQTAMLTNAVLTALSGLLVFLTIRRLQYGRGVALAVALAFGLGTMAWPYARYLFSETLAGLGLTASAYFLLRYRDDLGDASLVLAGTGLGIALLARLNNAIVAPFLGLALLTYVYRTNGRAWRRYLRPAILFGLPVLLALAIIAWYNLARFGNPLTTGYLPEERFSTPFFKGLYGLLLSPGRGLLWYNPLFWAALLGWVPFFRQHRIEALLAGAVVVSNVGFYAPWYLWWAGHAWGPRFLVTVLPFAVLPLAAAFQAAIRRRWLLGALVALSLVSVAVQILGVVTNFNLYLEDVYGELGLYHPATLFEPRYSPLLRQWAYVRRGNLDLAWARGGMLNWPALTLGLLAVTISGTALWAAWQQQVRRWAAAALVALLGLATLRSLILYAPAGDTADGARALAAMEHSGETAALTMPALTEAFQDAYDGSLPVWGVPSTAMLAGPGQALWSVGTAAPGPAVLRLSVGELYLAFYPAAGEAFDAGRLPVQRLDEGLELGQVVELLAVQAGRRSVRAGQSLAVDLYWRALAPMDTSYTVFLHVLKEDGTKAGQVDGLPCQGGCPTTSWRPGDIVAEYYMVPIAADAAPGTYRLIAGMYDLATGEHLPFVDAGTYLPLGTVQIQP